MPFRLTIGHPMRNSTCPISPLSAVAGGMLAGAVGTSAWTRALPEVSPRRRYREPTGLEVRARPGLGGSPGPRTGRQARGRGLHPARATGSLGLGRQHHRALGLRIDGGGTLRCPRRIAAQAAVLYGLPFAAAVWASGYVVLPQAGLYEPIWKYDARTLAWDLGAHLTYGAGTGTAFWLLTGSHRGRRGRRR